MLNRILLAAAMSWGFSVTLGVLFAARASGRFKLSTLGLPGVVPVALVAGTAAAVVMTPIVVWALRTGVKNLCVYAPILWTAMAAYIVVVIPSVGAHGLYGLFFLGAAGTALLGFIPPSK